jgi:hypothetical protein
LSALGAVISPPLTLDDVTDNGNTTGNAIAVGGATLTDATRAFLPNRGTEAQRLAITPLVEGMEYTQTNAGTGGVGKYLYIGGAWRRIVTGGELNQTVNFQNPLLRQRIAIPNNRNLIKVFKDSDISTVSYRILPSTTFIPLTFNASGVNTDVINLAANSFIEFAITFAGASTTGSIGVTMTVL